VPEFSSRESAREQSAREVNFVVRYYGRTYSPDVFRKKGIRGWYILLLARFVAWVETKIAWHVMHFIASQQGFAKDSVRVLEKSFKEDTRRPNNDLDVDSKEPRYMYRKNSPEKTYRENRARKSADFFAAYMAPQREGKYRYGRSQKLGDPDGDVEAVIPSVGGTTGGEGRVYVQGKGWTLPEDVA
jgi:hypothetical protein